MKRAGIVIGIILLCLVAVIAIATAGTTGENSEKTTSKTTITASTEATEGSDGGTSASPEKSEIEERERATYTTYDEDAFVADSNLQRVLVFYDKQHKPSVALDTLIETSLADLPTDVSIYRTTLSDSPDIATTLGITEPGAALSFDEQTQLIGVYVAPESPSLEAFRTILDLGK